MERIPVYLDSNVIIDMADGRENDLLGLVMRSIYFGPYCYLNLTSLIQEDGTHLARLKEDYASKAARSKQQRSPPSEKDESRHLSRLHSENERKSALIDQYEQLIKQLVRAKLLSEELHSCGLKDEAELDDDKKIALWARVEDQTSEHLKSAHQQAVAPAYQAPEEPPHRP